MFCVSRIYDIDLKIKSSRFMRQLSPDEQKAVINAFSNPEQTQAQGIRLAGQKFFTLQADPERVYGKKAVCSSVRLGSSLALIMHICTASFTIHTSPSPTIAYASRHITLVTIQADGCVIVKTIQAVLVTEYAAPTQAGEATTVVEGLADYLKSVGY